MKGKYISSDILMAILAKPVVAEKFVLREQKAKPDELKKMTALVRQLKELEAA